MSVSVRFTCNGATRSTSELRKALGTPCPAYVAVAMETGMLSDDLLVDTSDRTWLLETAWHDIPEGWTVDKNGNALCPAHQELATDGREVDHDHPNPDDVPLNGPVEP